MAKLDKFRMEKGYLMSIAILILMFIFAAIGFYQIYKAFGV